MVDPSDDINIWVEFINPHMVNLLTNASKSTRVLKEGKKKQTKINFNVHVRASIIRDMIQLEYYTFLSLEYRIKIWR